MYFRPTPKMLGSVIHFNIRFSSPPGSSHRTKACQHNALPSSPLLPLTSLAAPPSLPSILPLHYPCKLWPFSFRHIFPTLGLTVFSFRLFTSDCATMQSPRPRAEVIFSSDVRNMDDWARRTRIPLTTAEALGTTYARAHRWLQSLRLQLIRQHNWTDAPSSDPRMLFSLETSSIWRSSVGLPAGPQLKLQLPVHASSFFSPERRVQWQMVFHSDIFESVRKICPPINDILSLIQCLLTGVVTLVFEEKFTKWVYRTVRGLPSVSWINENEQALVEIFGVVHYRALRRACSDTETAYRLDVLPPHPR